LCGYISSSKSSSLSINLYLYSICKLAVCAITNQLATGHHPSSAVSFQLVACQLSTVNHQFNRHLTIGIGSSSVINITYPAGQGQKM
jgi:hypothetical protein